MAYKFDIILELLKAIAFLPEVSQLRVLKASIAYLKNTESEPLQGIENVAFSMLLPRLQEEKERELKLSLARSQCGKQGGRGKAKKAIALLALEKESTSLPSPTPPTNSPKEIFNLDNNTHTHIREENFDLMVGVLGTIEQYAHQYQKENIWADAAMMAHLTIAQTRDIFDQFVAEQKHNSARHSDYSDFKRHFLNYLRTKAERNRQQSKASNNGNQRKYDDRRGTEVSSSADYFEPL